MSKKHSIILAAMTALLTIGITGISWGAGTWQQTDTGWTYQQEDGSIPQNTWVQDQETWYHFDQNGFMQTGWFPDNGKWYYLTESGAMLRNTSKTIDGIKCTFDSSGAWRTQSGPGDFSSSLKAPANSWNGNVFVNQWANYTITFPDGYTDYAEYWGSSTDELVDFLMVSLDYENESLDYITVLYVDTAEEYSDYEGYTPESFLNESKEMTEEYKSYFGEMNIKVSNVTDVTLGELEFKKLSIQINFDDEINKYVDVYCRKLGDHLMFVMSVYSKDRTAAVNEILGSIRIIRK